MIFEGDCKKHCKIKATKCKNVNIKSVQMNLAIIYIIKLLKIFLLSIIMRYAAFTSLFTGQQKKKLRKYKKHSQHIKEAYGLESKEN